MTATLLHISFSPWSERARWALDARGIDVKHREYLSVIGELGLRKQLGKWSGKVSVPVLFTGDGAISDSFDIARWADAHGTGPTLFPAGKDSAVRHWNERSETALAAGRAVSLTRVLANNDALDELTPKPLRAFGAASRAVTRFAVARTRNKYDGGARSDTEHGAVLTAVLDELRAALGGDPTATLLGEFSYADITAAQALTFVSPVDRKHLRIGAANRTAFTNVDLVARYPDLLEWRDTLYARHR